MIQAYGEMLLYHFRMVNGYISRTVFWGIIPLDLVMHFLLGSAYTITGTWLKIRLRYILLTLLFWVLLKEYFDSFVIGSNMTEHLTDIAASLVYIFAVLLIRFFKKSRSSM